MRVHSDVPAYTRCNAQQLHERLEARVGPISIKDVARRYNIDPRTLAKWYTGELVTFHGAIIASLCHFYAVPPGRLFTIHVDEQKVAAK